MRKIYFPKTIFPTADAKDVVLGSSAAERRALRSANWRKEHKVGKSLSLSLRFLITPQAFVTLGLVMGAFLLCWLPFFLWSVFYQSLKGALTLQVMHCMMNMAVTRAFVIKSRNVYLRYLVSTICGSSCPPSPDIIVAILFWIGH